MVHATESVYAFYPSWMDSVGYLSKIFAFSAFTFGRLGVPLFCLLTGYLVLDRSYKTAADITAFWKSKLLPLVLAYWCWTAINELFTVLFLNQNFELHTFIARLLFLKNSPMTHMWYMGMIIGMYLVLPFISIILEKCSLRTLIIPTALFFFYCFLVPDCNVLRAINSKDMLLPQISLDYSGSTYGLYIISGYYFRISQSRLMKIKSERRSLSWFLLGASLATFFSMVTFQLWTYKTAFAYNVWYNHTALFICAHLVFSFLCTIQSQLVFKRIWCRISIAATGIYFIHLPVLLILKMVPGLTYSEHRSAQVLCLGIACFFISWSLIEILSFLPGIPNTLFLRKSYRKGNEYQPSVVSPPNQKQSECQRIEYLDFLKTISIFLVVFCHNVVLDQNSILGNIFMTIAWCACPLFFMCSGAVYISSKTWSWAKWRKRLFKTYTLICVWKFLYFLFYKWLSGVVCSIQELICYIFLFGSLHNVVTGHFWFMNAYIALLLLLPMMWILYHAGNNGKIALIAIAVVSYLGSSFIYSLNLLVSILSNAVGVEMLAVASLTEVMPFGSHGNMIVYFIAGVFLHENADKISVAISNKLKLIYHPKSLYLISASIGLALLLAIKYHQTGSMRWNFVYLEYGYEWFSTVILTFSVYMLCQSIRYNRHISTLATYIGTKTQSIFYLHVPLLSLLVKYVYPYTANYWSFLANCIKTIAVLIVCLLVHKFMKKIPLLNQLL